MNLKYEIGDRVYVPNLSPSTLTMSFYVEHPREFECPCKYRNVKGTVIKIFGNFVYLKIDLINTITAYHIRDIRLIKKEEELE